MNDTNIPDIATLTFHRANNYGALFQCFALQQAIIDIGRRTEVIDYSSDASDGFAWRPPHTLGSMGAQVILAPSRNKRKRAFRSFSTNYLSISGKVNKSQFKTVASSYKGIIVGSDQVWNPTLTRNDTTYFLDFHSNSCRKMAYAASIGLDRFPKNDEQKYLTLVNSFDKITVREASAADYLQRKLKKPIDVVCDPVFLLDEERWSEIADRPPQDKRYVLIYSVGGAERDCVEFARTLAAQRNLDTVAIHRSPHSVKGARNIRDAGPEEFLGWIRHADVVVTESFHGCCFSILFHKEFYCVPAQRLQSKQARINDLLSTLSFQDRITSSQAVVIGCPNYRSGDERLQRFIAHSKNCLEEMLQ